MAKWPYGQDLRKFLWYRTRRDKVRTVVCKSPTTPIAHTYQPRARAKMLFLEDTGMEEWPVPSDFC